MHINKSRRPHTKPLTVIISGGRIGDVRRGWGRVYSLFCLLFLLDTLLDPFNVFFFFFYQMYVLLSKIKIKISLVNAKDLCVTVIQQTSVERINVLG